jgi:hypothetical protein
VVFAVVLSVAAFRMALAVTVAGALGEGVVEIASFLHHTALHVVNDETPGPAQMTRDGFSVV